MCKPFCSTVAKVDTPQGEVELIAAAKPIAGDLKFHAGRLTMVIPGETICKEFCGELSSKTWLNAWESLIGQIRQPRHQYKKIFREKAVIDLLEQASAKVALLPV